MKITWYGHAAFAIEALNDEGEPRKIILDPYNYPDCGGYLPIDEHADVVCISHRNQKYHSDLSSIRGDYELIEGLRILSRAKKAAGMRFQGHRVYENDAREGPNAMVKFTLEGITVAHQGDLGHAPRGSDRAFLQDVDVLLTLAGGPPTVRLPDLVRLIADIGPSLVFPMHYKTEKVNLDILPPERFLELCGDFAIQRPESSSFDVDLNSLPDSPTIVVLDHAR